MATRYTVSEAERSFAGDEWQVTAIDHDSEGECYVAMFSGSKAKARAMEYARWKNSQEDSHHPASLRSIVATQLANPV